MADQYALCIENRECDDLEKRKLYQVVPDEDAAKEGYLRVIDESREGYLYPQSYFMFVFQKQFWQLFKYLRLEAYEDTLESLEATPPSSARRALLAEAPDLAEVYRLRYALGAETAGSACLLGGEFTDPFAYAVTVMRDGAWRVVTVDLPETFNYLLGLRVESRQRIDGVLAIAGTDPKGRRCLILWRSLRGTGYAALCAWFIRHRERFPRPLHLIYVNGAHTLNALRPPGESWKAELIEPIFRKLMFKEEQQ